MKAGKIEVLLSKDKKLTAEFSICMANKKAHLLIKINDEVIHESEPSNVDDAVERTVKHIKAVRNDKQCAEEVIVESYMEEINKFMEDTDGFHSSKSAADMIDKIVSSILNK